MDDSGNTPALRSAHRRWRWYHLALLLVGAVAVTVWLERRHILTRVIDDRLARARVPARYTIADLGAGRQRLTNIVVGDPADPDLVADWVETRTGIGLRGPYLAAVSAGGVRAKARMVDGRLSFGSIDRLLSTGASSGPSLPALNLSLQDTRLWIATPAGPVLVALAGSGRLDDGFAGPVALVAPRLAIAGCTVRDVRGAMALRSLGPDGRGGQVVRLAGPLGIAHATCGGATLETLDSRTTINLALGRPQGLSVEAQLRTGAVGDARIRAAAVTGTIAVAQTANGRMAGRVALTADRVRSATLRAAAVSVDGGIAAGTGGALYDGDIRVTAADLGDALPRLAAPAGTPVAPLVVRLDRALAAAARNLSGDAQLHVRAGSGVAVAVRSARLRSASGAFATVEPADATPVAIRWAGGDGLAFAARLATGGGGLPDLRATLSQSDAAAPFRVAATMRPYAAPAATLSLAPVTATIAGDGSARLVTRLGLSGPIGDGRVEGLTMAIDARRLASGAWLLGPRCTPLAFRRLAVSGLTLDPGRLSLCPADGALIRVAGGRVGGGIRIDAPDLTGRLGTTPIAISARGASLRPGTTSFAIYGVGARLGSADRATQLTADRLTGTIADGGVRGLFAGADGRIANVPLILSAGMGHWRFANGVLALDADAQVADADAAPRFRPMQTRAIAFTLTNGRIAVTGALHEPTTGTHVADVRIAHDLAGGTGDAGIAVPGLTFSPAFQPDLLTPLTFGVIADVRGRIDGEGRIAWGPDGVVSRGDFGTAGLDLAAAFGPATGIAGRVRFDDLLGLHTPPGQVATVRSVNPGIAVENGTVRYQLLGGTRVQVEGAEWPFAGGALTLDASLLDFDARQSRRLTFRVAGARADQFLQQFDFQNLNATGVFDGVLPMIFDESGGRIEDGRLAMRAGGGTIAYVGALGQEQLGVWGNLAFQALRSLRYRSLTLAMNGPLAGEMVTDVRFAGVSQGEGAKSNFIIRRLQRLPFVFNVRIRAPFRGLIDSAASFYDPRRLIQRNLPALLEEQNRLAPPRPAPAPPADTRRPIQPPASETVR